MTLVSPRLVPFDSSEARTACSSMQARRGTPHEDAQGLLDDAGLRRIAHEMLLTQALWVGKASVRRQLTPAQFLAVVLWTLGGNSVDLDADLRRVRAWAQHLRLAVDLQGLQPLDPITGLPMPQPPGPCNWSWCVGVAALDQFVAGVGQEWRVSTAMQTWLGQLPEHLRSQYAADRAPAGPPPDHEKESREERQHRRYQKCLAAGLEMPAHPKGRMPMGIGRVAAKLGISRQALVADLRQYIGRR